jgi:MarR family 2-MHQ and catechol resistance regulon transcriptional repressor
MKQRYLRSIRLLAESYQLFEQLSGAEIRGSGLTPAQFDIIATLANTAGMSFKELGEKTLITKGTLTGVIERMVGKDLVRRVTRMEDRRSMTVHLTEKGQQEFQRRFAPHVQFCKQPFVDYSEDDYAALERELRKLKDSLGRVVSGLK